jgi:hypothetical protein
LSFYCIFPRMRKVGVFVPFLFFVHFGHCTCTFYIVHCTLYIGTVGLIYPSMTKINVMFE